MLLGPVSISAHRLKECSGSSALQFLFPGAPEGLIRKRRPEVEVSTRIKCDTLCIMGYSSNLSCQTSQIFLCLTYPARRGFCRLRHHSHRKRGEQGFLI